MEDESPQSVAPNKESVTPNKAADIRQRLVEIALEWQSYFGVAPSITSAISELDAALLVGMAEDEYCAGGRFRTAVSKDVDFIYDGLCYQVTANRPSGKKGSPVTLVSQKTENKRPFGWDRLIWILYDRFYVLQEAWEFTAEEYRTHFTHVDRLSPTHMRLGRCLTGLKVANNLSSENPLAKFSVSPRTDEKHRADKHQMTQRDKMRDLVAQFGFDEEKVCAAYAHAEEIGEVPRKRDKYGISAEDYAVRLWNDGVRKGWLSVSHSQRGGG